MTTRLTGKEISDCVYDIVKRGTTQPVSWYLEKYQISKDEFDDINWAAIPATAYKGMMGKYKMRLLILVNAARKACAAGTKLGGEIDRDEINYIFGQITKALDSAEAPFEENYMNDEMEGL